MELVGSDDPRCFKSLGPTLHPNQLDRVFVRQFSPLRTLKNRVHKALYMAFGLWGEIQTLKPILNCHWLDGIQRCIGPARSDVVVDVRLVR